MSLLDQGKLFLKPHASTILTIIGGIGVIATVVTAVKVTPKAMQLIEEAKKEKGDELTKWETVKVASPVYIPSVVAGVSTIACIFGANVLNKKKQASLMSAYALLDTSYKDYKTKAAELFGKGADEQIKTEIAKDNYDENGIQNKDDGKLLFYDTYSQRYYRATTEKVLLAELQINEILNKRESASLNEYYSLLDLPPIEFGDDIGWVALSMYDANWDSWLHFFKTEIVMEDGTDCIMVDFTAPSLDFVKY